MSGRRSNHQTRIKALAEFHTDNPNPGERCSPVCNTLHTLSLIDLGKTGLFGGGLASFLRGLYHANHVVVGAKFWWGKCCLTAAAEDRLPAVLGWGVRFANVSKGQPDVTERAKLCSPKAYF
jgi:hypothetical protein